MAKIPEYQQGKLASSLVGEPVPDNSGRTLVEAGLSNQAQIDSTLQNASNISRNAAENAFGAVTSGIQSAFNNHEAAQQKANALAAKQHVALVNHDVTNHTNNLDLQIYKATSDVVNDKTIAPESVPDLLEKTLYPIQQSYIQSNNIQDQDTIDGITKATDPSIRSAIKTATDNVATWKTANALSLSKATNDNVVNNTTTVPQYDMQVARLDTPEMKTKFLADFGSKSPEAMQEYKQKLGENVIRSVANNDPKGLKDLQDSGKIKDVPATVWNSAVEHANSLQTTALNNAVSQHTLTQGTDAVSIAAATGLLDPKSTSYRNDLDRAKQQLTGQLATQLKLPDVPPNAKAMTDVNGNYIPTKNGETISKISTQLGSVEKQIKIYDTSIGKEKVASEKQTVSNFIAQQDARRLGPEGQTANANLQNAILELGKFTPGLGMTREKDITRAKKDYATSNDELAAYTKLADTYHAGVSNGLIDQNVAKTAQDLIQKAHDRIEAGHKAPDGSSFWNFLTNTPPDTKYKNDVEQMLHKVLNPDVTGIQYIMGVYKGLTGKATQRVVSSNLIELRNKYKADPKHPDEEPTAARVHQWNMTIQRKMVDRGLFQGDVVPDAPPEE
jgi:hypothetical protein